MKHQPLYRTILREAWERTRTRPDRWILGFFAAFLQLGGVIDIFIRIFSRIPRAQGNLLNTVGSTYPGAGFIGIISNAHAFRFIRSPLGILAVVVVLVLILGIFYFLSIAEGALISGSIFSGKMKSNKKTIRAAEIRAGRTAAWPVASVHIVGKFLVGVAFLFLSLPLLLLATHATIANALFAVTGFVLSFLILIFISFVSIYTIIGIVVDQQSLSRAFTSATQVLRSHWLISIETAIVLFAVRMLVGVGAALLLLIVSVPATLLVLAGIAATSSLFVSITVAAFLALAILLLMITGALITTFELTAWTLLFEKIHKGDVVAKLVRLVHAAIPRFRSR